jgi:parvulin-like peptidyl-prolyl isomerase
MNRTALSLVLGLASVAAFAQQPAAPAATSDSQPKPVVIVNGDIITDQKLDQLYSEMGAQMREQYEKNGGKRAFLDNYLRKRLIVQEAIKHGFDKRPDIQAEVEAAKEAALFQAYIREEIASSVVTEADIKKYYEDNKANFATPEAINVRHIIIIGNGAGPHPKSQQDAATQIQRIAEELRESVANIPDPQMKSRVLLAHFEDAAKKYSEDGSATIGGALGWQTRGSGLDPQFEDVAFSLTPGSMSPVVQTRFGYHLIFLEDKRPSGTQPYEAVRNDIREYLQSQKMQDIMQQVTKLSNELKKDSKISSFPENLH